MLSNYIIKVEGRRISEVGQEIEIPEYAKVIDLSDYTLLPGLIDGHTHLMTLDNLNDDNPMATPGETPEEPCVTWQTEFPRRVPNQSGQVSIVLMRGSLHKIVLKNILYIDVGKKTQRGFYDYSTNPPTPTED